MNKLERIVEILRGELADGKYPPGSRFPSEYELVRRFDVCRSTANKAVAMFCGEGLLCRGQRGAGTRVLKKGTRPQKKIVFLGNIGGFATLVLRGVVAAAGERGAQVTLLAPRMEDLDLTLNNLVAEGFHSGIVTYGYRLLPDTLPLPVIYIDEALPEYLPDRHYVVNRNYEGAQQMMRALWDRGHRNIAICANTSYLQTHRFYRVRGFMETLADLSRTDVSNRL